MQGYKLLVRAYLRRYLEKKKKIRVPGFSRTPFYIPLCVVDRRTYIPVGVFSFPLLFFKKSFRATSCQRGLLAAELEDERRDQEHQERVQVQSEMKGGFKHIHDAASV